MRQFKFRVWNIEEKRMIGSDRGVYTCLKDAIGASTGSGFSDCDCSAKKGRYVFMQYTGLKDRNGVEIFEGDILKICNGSINGFPWMDPPRLIKYNLNSGFNVHSFMWDKDGKNDMDSTHWCEVMGNIFKNPELMKAAPEERAELTDNNGKADNLSKV